MVVPDMHPQRSSAGKITSQGSRGCNCSVLSRRVTVHPEGGSSHQRLSAACTAPNIPVTLPMMMHSGKLPTGRAKKQDTVLFLALVVSICCACQTFHHLLSAQTVCREVRQTKTEGDTW